jgi:hypothetical protein
MAIPTQPLFFGRPPSAPSSREQSRFASPPFGLRSLLPHPQQAHKMFRPQQSLRNQPKLPYSFFAQSSAMAVKGIKLKRSRKMTNTTPRDLIGAENLAAQAL